MKNRLCALAASASLALLIAPASGEILLLPDGGVASVDPEYAYAHPTLPSLVFASPALRQMAILPPSPVFVTPPPLLMRSGAAPFPLYPPSVYGGGLNVPVRPSNRDLTTYNLQRAHAFGQQLYYRENALGFGGFAPVFGAYGYGGLMPLYPPASAAGFNQPARPSNRDINTYNLERAHRFSTDSYRQP